MPKKAKLSMQDEMFIEIWRVLFRHCFGFKVDFGKIVFPQAKGDRILPIIMPWELTQGNMSFVSRIYNACKESFRCRNCWGWEKLYRGDLDKYIIHNDRTPKNGSYVVRANNHIDATDGDEELGGLWYSEIWERALPVMTYPERLMFELYIFRATGIHLDTRDITSCAGSRCLDGSAPSIYWDSEGLGSYDNREYRGGRRRARSVVTAL